MSGLGMIVKLFRGSQEVSQLVELDMEKAVAFFYVHLRDDHHSLKGGLVERHVPCRHMVSKTVAQDGKLLESTINSLVGHSGSVFLLLLHLDFRDTIWS